jgi:hypothetical protein
MGGRIMHGPADAVTRAAAAAAASPPMSQIQVVSAIWIRPLLFESFRYF